MRIRSVEKPRTLLVCMRIVLLGVVAGCGGDDAASEAGSSSDAASPVRISSLPEISLVEERRLGSVGDPETGFSSVSRVEVSRAGTVFVSDGQDRKVKVYDSLGAHLSSIGGRGRGPGEFEMITEFGLVGDTLWVRDGGTRRITLFDFAGELITTVTAVGETITMAGVQDASVRVSPRRPRGDGLFDSEVSVSGADALPDSFQVPDLVFDRTGKVVDTAGAHVVRPRESAGTRITIPAGLVVIFRNPWNEVGLGGAVGTDSIIIRHAAATSASDPEIDVTRATRQRDTVYQARLTYTPRPASQQFKDSVTNDVLRLPLRMVAEGRMQPEPVEQTRAAISAILSPYSHVPPIDLHHVGKDGAVWLRTQAGEGGPRRWVLLDPDGKPRGTIDLAETSRVMWSSGDVVWIVERDAVDIPWVVKYRLGRT
jgi:hypothetical protein